MMPVSSCHTCSLLPFLLTEVSRLAGVLVRNGINTGDLVVIYMPMVPQAMFTMLACARIGATHSLIFGGFASRELSVRIDHAKVGAGGKGWWWWWWMVSTGYANLHAA